MSNIVKFPGAYNAVPELPDKPTTGRQEQRKALVAGLLRFIWVCTVLLWPILKWVLSVEVFFQFVRMLYHWNTPGAYAGWTFALHFAVLTAVTYFVSIYKPKGISNSDKKFDFSR